MTVEVISTIVTAASDYDLTDIATVRAELGISGTANDAMLRRYISAASAAASQYCNRVFVAETVQDRFDIFFPRLQFAGLPRLQASRWPINSVTSVAEIGVTLVKNTDYLIDGPSGHLVRLNANGDPTPWNASPVVAVFNGGFATIPSDLEDAVIRMIRARWFAKDRDPFTRQESIPGVRDVSYWVPTGSDAGNLTPDVADILDNYRQPLTA